MHLWRQGAPQVIHNNAVRLRTSVRLFLSLTILPVGIKMCGLGGSRLCPVFGHSELVESAATSLCSCGP